MTFFCILFPAPRVCEVNQTGSALWHDLNLCLRDSVGCIDLEQASLTQCHVRLKQPGRIGKTVIGSNKNGESCSGV